MATVREVLSDLVRQAPRLSGDRQSYIDAIEAAFPVVAAVLPEAAPVVAAVEAAEPIVRDIDDEISHLREALADAEARKAASGSEEGS